MMQYIALILVLVLLIVGAVAVMSNSTQISSDGVSIHNPLGEAGAQATRSAADVEYQNSQLDLSIRKSLNEVEVEARRSEIEANTTAKLIVATVEAGAMVQSIQAQTEAETQVILAVGEAKTQAVSALGIGGYIALIAMGIGLAIAVVVLATGHSIANVKHAVLAANYVQIGVESRTLLPPPLVITQDGYLIDTRSGERARLRDTVGVDRLRLAATTHSTETAQLAQAEIEIAKATKSDKTADALMSAAGSVPMLDTRESANSLKEWREN